MFTIQKIVPGFRYRVNYPGGPSGDSLYEPLRFAIVEKFRIIFHFKL